MARVVHGARAAAAALAGFLRGFVGATRIGSDAHSVQCALAHRAESRRGCC
jgi:hypothetical protein